MHDSSTQAIVFNCNPKFITITNIAFCTAWHYVPVIFLESPGLLLLHVY